jgi:hypothetical protein
MIVYKLYWCVYKKCTKCGLVMSTIDSVQTLLMSLQKCSKCALVLATNESVQTLLTCLQKCTKAH